MTGVAFVCVGNAGRSQMATAFAQRERDRRGLDLDIMTGGTDPRERVHDEVLAVMAEAGFDLSDRRPRAITEADIRAVEHVVTMGCSVDQFRRAGWDGGHREWDLADPDGEDLDAVRQQRDEIERRVVDFFDELEAGRETDR